MGQGGIICPNNRPQWCEAQNEFTAEVPAHSVVRVTGASYPHPGQTLYTISQPTYGTSGPIFAINGPVAIGAGKTGVITFEGPVIASYDSSGGTPAAGDMLGPREDQWHLTKGNVGFICQGSVDTKASTCLVTRAHFGVMLAKTVNFARARDSDGSLHTTTAYIHDVSHTTGGITNSGERVTCWNMRSLNVGEDSLVYLGFDGRTYWILGTCGQSGDQSVGLKGISSGLNTVSTSWMQIDTSGDVIISGEQGSNVDCVDADGNDERILVNVPGYYDIAFGADIVALSGSISNTSLVIGQIEAQVGLSISNSDPSSYVVSSYMATVASGVSPLPFTITRQMHFALSGGDEVKLAARVGNYENVTSPSFVVRNGFILVRPFGWGERLAADDSYWIGAT